MQIQSLCIRNFKSIRELEILDVESSLILVSKNNTGKTAVLDAIRAVTGNYTVGAHDFNEKRQNIEIDMVLEITGEDLQQFHAQGLVSGYKKFDAWMQEVQELLPSFKENALAFTCVINYINGYGAEYLEKQAKRENYITVEEYEKKRAEDRGQIRNEVYQDLIRFLATVNVSRTVAEAKSEKQNGSYTVGTNPMPNDEPQAELPSAMMDDIMKWS